ncbi:unnamed protein product [Mytilus coruscus]|uniref:Uncharacterized protein n=1 Tax=Mytilus coruscus TaxID=42192 RepID=A0A6J8CIM4_MYTCO|nr:unnamed protein product [Mytilus coruscus]
MSGANVDISSRSKDTQNLQVILSSLKQEVDALNTKRLDMQVDEALANIRTLASRPKLTAPHVLLAAIETLVDIAHTTYHKDAAMFSKAFSTCKKYEDNEEFCSLVFKFFGTQEDTRIASLVADWAKSRKYEGGDKLRKIQGARCRMITRFDPEKALGRGFTEFSWVNAIAEITQPSSHITSAEEVARGESFDFDQLVFRDPNNFLSGSSSNNLATWEEIDTPSEHIGWIKDGVDIHSQNSEEAILVKEVFAILNTLKSVQSQLIDHQVDAFCDNMAVVEA